MCTAKCGSGRPLPPIAWPPSQSSIETTVGASLSPYVPSTGLANFASNAARTGSGQSPPPFHTSSSDARSSATTSSLPASEWISAGGPFQVVTRSVRIHSATPTTSLRSKITAHPPACAVRSVVSTCMLRMVSGRKSPLRSAGP